MKNRKDFDVIIIGGGVAGMSAALWCDELGLKALLIEKEAEFGGQLLWTYNAIENYLGIKAKNGKELRNVFVAQLNERKFETRLKAKITKIELKNKCVHFGDNEIYSTRALILANGVRRRTLGIPGEKRFQGKGIIKSGKRDKDLVKDKKVLIVGGGDAALENAEILSETATEIFIVHRREEFSARSEFIETAKRIKKVTFLTSTTLEEICGDNQIESVKLRRKNKTTSLLIDAVLFRIGVEPNTKNFANELELNPNGYIKINSECETNLSGVFAIGDIANPTSPTISSAVGMGATAIKSIHKLLEN